MGRILVGIGFLDFNNSSTLYRILGSRFRSYLRGMETFSWQFWNVGPKWIPILPTRHGNSSRWAICSGWLYPFRSYLRGMETPQSDNIRKVTSYSDPTYEAWKQKFLFGHKCILRDSDPTYEAWKQEIATSIDAKLVKFRSYLRGMETPAILAKRYPPIHIPILPTRHGNCNSFPH